MRYDARRPPISLDRRTLHEQVTQPVGNNGLSLPSSGDGVAALTAQRGCPLTVGTAFGSHRVNQILESRFQ